MAYVWSCKKLHEAACAGTFQTKEMLHEKWLPKEVWVVVLGEATWAGMGWAIYRVSTTDRQRGEDGKVLGQYWQQQGWAKGSKGIACTFTEESPLLEMFSPSPSGSNVIQWYHLSDPQEVSGWHVNQYGLRNQSSLGMKHFSFFMYDLGSLLWV